MPATAPAASTHPDPDRALPARLDPAGVGKILRLLRTLVAYGRNLVETLRQEDDPDDIPWYAFLTSLFGTTDPALITVVIIRGLLRFAALRARLGKSVAALLPFPLRDGRAAKRIDGGRGPGPRSPRPPDGPSRRAGRPGDPSLDRLPTAEQEIFAEIAAADRDRPIGAILLDICLDLAIVPGLMDPATWNELRLAIALYGGDPAPLLADPAGSAGVTAAGQETPDLFRGHSATGTPAPATALPFPLPASPSSPIPHGQRPRISPSPRGRTDGRGARPVRHHRGSHTRTRTGPALGPAPPPKRAIPTACAKTR